MSLGLQLRLRRRNLEAKGPFADLDRKLKRYLDELASTKEAVKEAGGAYARMDQYGVWRCRMRAEAGKYERLEARSSEALLELVKAWQVKHDKAEAAA